MSSSNIKRNFAYNMLYQLLAIIVPIITSPYLARVLGAEKIGIYSWTYSIVFYFMIFSVLGINNYGNRTIAYNKDCQEKLSTSFCSIYACQLFMSILMVIFYTAYILFGVDKYHVIFIIQGIHILSYAIDITWFFYGMEEFKVTVTRNSVVKILSLLSIFIFVKDASDLWIYTLIVTGSVFLGHLCTWPILISKIRFVKPTLKDIKVHIKPIIILFIPVLAISVFTNMDKYMIGKMCDISQSGYYENTEKIIGIPKSLITALGTVMLPRTVSLIATGQENKSKQYIETTMLYTVAFSSALVFGMSGVADIFSVVFWGEEFAECGKMIAVMSPAILFSVFGNVVRTQYLIPRSKDKEYTISLIVGAIVNFLLNIFMIQMYGALGAVVATVIAEFSMTFLQTFFVRKILPIKRYVTNGIGFLVIGFIMYVIIRIVHSCLTDSVFNLLCLILIGGFVYLILSVLYLSISKKEINILFRDAMLQMLKRKIMKDRNYNNEE